MKRLVTTLPAPTIVPAGKLTPFNIKDESLGIDWRIPMEKAILSEKDLKHACLKDAVLDFDINDKLY